LWFLRFVVVFCIVMEELSIVHCLDEETTILCMYLIAYPQNKSQTAC